MHLCIASTLFHTFSKSSLAGRGFWKCPAKHVHKATAFWKILLSREATPFSSIHSTSLQSSWGLQRCAWNHIATTLQFTCLLFLQSWITDPHKQPNLGWPFVVFWFEKVQGTLKVSVKCTRCSIIKAAAQARSDAGSVWMFPRCQVPSIAGMEVESIGDLKRNQKES